MIPNYFPLEIQHAARRLEAETGKVCIGIANCYANASDYGNEYEAIAIRAGMNPRDVTYHEVPLDHIAVLIPRELLEAEFAEEDEDEEDLA